MRDFEEAVRRGPDRATHYLNYSRLFALAKEWPAADSVLARGLVHIRGVEAIPLLLEKARVCNEQEEAAMGLEAADEVLALSPENGRALYQRGWALGMLGRLREAESSMSQLVRQEPDNKSAAAALNRLIAALPAQPRTEATPPPQSRTERPAVDFAAQVKPWWKFW